MEIPASMLVKPIYAGRGLRFKLEVYTRFFKKTNKGFVIIVSRTDKAAYPGVDKHFCTEDTGRMGAIDRASFETYTMQSGLYDNVLLGMNSAAYFLSLPRRDTLLIPQTTQFKAII